MGAVAILATVRGRRLAARRSTAGDGSRSGTFLADPEAVFTYGAPQLKFGVGAADEIGFDLSQHGVRRVQVAIPPYAALAAGHGGRARTYLADFPKK